MKIYYHEKISSMYHVRLKKGGGGRRINQKFLIRILAGFIQLVVLFTKLRSNLQVESFLAKLN